MTSSDEFMMGGRSLNFWVIALSAHASDMSSWLFMAFPAAIMIRGLPELWMAVGLFLGMFLTWQFVAVRLRESTEQLDSTHFLLSLKDVLKTIPESSES